MFVAVAIQKKSVTGRPSTITAATLLAMNNNARTAMNTAWTLVGGFFLGALMSRA